MARLGPIEYLIVVYENVWVAAMAAQLQGSGTRVVATGVIPAARTRGGPEWNRAGRVAARQQSRWAQQTAAPPVAHPPRDTDAVIAQRGELGRLRDAGC